MTRHPNPNRRLAGLACVALAFALVVLLGTGVVSPPGMPATVGSLGALLAGLAPSVLAALALFLLGLWLLKGGRRP
jgi:hypothetical protein